MTEAAKSDNSATAHQRAYDFLKHLTGVSLVSLGGIMGLLGGQGPQVPKAKLIVMMGFVGLAGAVSLFTAATIVTNGDLGDGKRVSARAVRLSLGIAVWSLSFGLGAAIQTFAALLM